MVGLIQEVIIADVSSERTGLIYPRFVLEKAVAEYQLTHIDKKRALGIFNAPNSVDFIDLDRVSHRIEALFWKDDVLMANVEILRTPMGIIVETFLEHKIQVKLHLCGVGSLTNKTVNDDFKIIQIWIDV